MKQDQTEYASLKKGVSRQEVSCEREFQRRGAVQLKALAPMVDKQACGVVSWIAVRIWTECEYEGVQSDTTRLGLKSLTGEKQNLEADAVFDMEPVKLLKGRSDVLSGGSLGNNSGS